MTPYYTDGGVTIYHGDCLAILPQLAELRVNLTVTSPPYNTLDSRIPNRPTGMHASNAWLTKVRDQGYADSMDEDQYRVWQMAVAYAVRAVTVAGGSLFYNHKIKYRDARPVHPIDLARAFAGWHLRQEIVWDRCGAFAFNARMFAPNDERIYWLIRDDPDAAPYPWNQESASCFTTWRLAPDVNTSDHPCPFPEEIPARCIRATTVPNDLVLDPFGGSGTTAVAAKRLGRRCVLIDRDERYCEMAARRLGQGALDLFGVEP